MIRAVTFDLWETLLREDESQNARRAEMRVDVAFDALGGEVTRDALRRAHAEVWRHMELSWKAHRDLAYEAQVRLFLGIAVGAPFTGEIPPAVLTTYADAALAAPPRLDPHAADVLATVASWNLKIGLISNTGRTPGATLRKILDRAGVLRHFTVTLFSDETIVRKPLPEIFNRALDALAIPAADAVHVGDSAPDDMAGGKAAGMRTLQIWRGREARSLRSPDADYVVESLDAVPAILDRLVNADPRRGP